MWLNYSSQNRLKVKMRETLDCKVLREYILPEDIVSCNETSDAVFVTVVRSVEAEKEVRLLAKSIRSFAGSMSGCPVWVFSHAPERLESINLEALDVEVIPLRIPESISGYLFADTVSACDLAECRAKGKLRSMIWIDTSCLVVRPPLLFELGQDADAAVRPVHIRNVGSHASEPPDGYWQGIFDAVGVKDVSSTVESFVGGELIRSYFNTHAFAVNPAMGLMTRWFELFKSLVTDKEFQAGHCSGELHKVFLFQALLSTLLATEIEPARLRILPPDYNYPYNLHEKVPDDRKAKTLEELTTFTYEGRAITPEEVKDIDIGEQLKNWLAERI